MLKNHVLVFSKKIMGFFFFFSVQNTEQFLCSVNCKQKSHEIICRLEWTSDHPQCSNLLNAASLRWLGLEKLQGCETIQPLWETCSALDCPHVGNIFHLYPVWTSLVSPYACWLLSYCYTLLHGSCQHLLNNLPIHGRTALSLLQAEADPSIRLPHRACAPASACCWPSAGLTPVWQ